jgi:hypothetical protein
MVQCTCGKSIEKIPNWLQGVKAEFVCNNCPNRNTKNIAVVSMEIDKKLAGGAATALTLPATEDDDIDLEDE